MLAATGACGASYDASALGELIGTRGPSNGISFVTGTSFSINWTITQISGGYHYAYSITGVSGPQLGVSHFALNTSTNCTNSNGCVTNAVVNGSAVASTSLVFGPNTSSNGNVNFPGSFFGVRFEGLGQQLPFTVEFDSVRVPVYGDFYLKLGQGGGTLPNGGSGWNTGASNHASTNIIDFIARPDTDVASLPEPGTLAMIGFSLVAIGLCRRRTW